jgi:hypothetical protein
MQFVRPSINPPPGKVSAGFTRAVMLPLLRIIDIDGGTNE